MQYYMHNIVSLAYHFFSFFHRIFLFYLLSPFIAYIYKNKRHVKLTEYICYSTNKNKYFPTIYDTIKINFCLSNIYTSYMDIATNIWCIFKYESLDGGLSACIYLCLRWILFTNTNIVHMDILLSLNYLF
jgi:hypothetical protein